MVDGSRAWGIALLSGSGGVGRTTLAVALAEFLAHAGARTLLLDLCFGWGGLSLNRTDLPTYEGLLDADDIDNIVRHSSLGFDMASCIPPDILDPSPDDLKKIEWLVGQAGSVYDYVIIDPPSGSHPLSLLAAGLCERTLLLARPDNVSIAASYRLLETLNAEGLSQRVGIVFARVDSSDSVAELKMRLDGATSRFLDIRIDDAGSIPRLERNLSRDLNAEMPAEGAGDLLAHLNLHHIAPFHNATKIESSLAGFRVSAKVRR